MATTFKTTVTKIIPFHEGNLRSLDIGINDPAGNPRAFAPTDIIDLITLSKEDILESFSIVSTSAVSPATLSFGLKTYDVNVQGGVVLFDKYFADLAPADPPLDAAYDRGAKLPFDIAKLASGAGAPAGVAGSNIDGLLHNRRVGTVMNFYGNSNVWDDAKKELLGVNTRVLESVTLTLKASATIPIAFRINFNIKYKRKA